jgi:hypothetical protein
VDYPVNRSELARVAEEGGASVDVINVLLSLPAHFYRSRDQVLRDLAEASRRFGMGNQPADEDGANRDRRNIGRDAVEGAPAPLTRHP